MSLNEKCKCGYFIHEGNKAVLSDQCGVLACEGCYLSRHDPVNHPKHYTSHPSGVECITVTEHMNFNVGNAVKYLWRSDQKNGLEDLKKARWYVDREIQRLEKTNG